MWAPPSALVYDRLSVYVCHRGQGAEERERVDGQLAFLRFSGVGTSEKSRLENAGSFLEITSCHFDEESCLAA